MIRNMVVTRINPMDPKALVLIDGSETEQAALYPPELRSAFSPEQLVAADVRFFIACDGGEPVTCGGYAHCGDFAELKRIYVAPAFRGAGWADALITTCEDHARQEGLGWMRLETGKASPAAVRLYTKLGYLPCGPFGSYRENGSSIFMEKQL